MRRYVWGVLLVMVVGAVAARGVFVTRHRMARAESAVICIDDCPVAVAAPPVQRVAPAPPIPQVNVRKKQRVEAQQDAPPKKPAKTSQSDTTITREKVFKSDQLVKQKDARNDVLDQAVTWATHELNLGHAADRELFARPDIAELQFSKGESVDGIDTHVATLRVSLTRAAERELHDLDRRVVAADRMDTAGRGVAWLTVLFGAVAGFVRLDEWTKGYYTKRLGALMGAAVLAATALIVSV